MYMFSLAYGQVAVGRIVYGRHKYGRYINICYLLTYVQGQGLLITEDGCCYEGEFSGGPNLSGKVFTAK